MFSPLSVGTGLYLRVFLNEDFSFYSFFLHAYHPCGRRAQSIRFRSGLDDACSSTAEIARHRYLASAWRTERDHQRRSELLSARASLGAARQDYPGECGPVGGGPLCVRLRFLAHQSRKLAAKSPRRMDVE